MTDLLEGSVAARAWAWRHEEQAAVCDVLEPWAYGTVARATGYPSFFDFNVVRVERDPQMSVPELAGFADAALAGLAHRRIDFELAAAAEPLRSGFEAAGWTCLVLLWMRHETPAPPSPDVAVAVEEVPYDAAHPLRIASHDEDFPDKDPVPYLAQRRKVALRRRTRTLIVREQGAPVGFAELEREGSGAEITHVYVSAEHRGAGRGTALTTAAINLAGDASDLWITADNDDRAKDLYARLGFRSACVMIQFRKLP